MSKGDVINEFEKTQRGISNKIYETYNPSDQINKVTIFEEDGIWKSIVDFGGDIIVSEWDDLECLNELWLTNKIYSKLESFLG
ncbi:MAG: hypothetical protein GF311_26580 [Candidatus Lokiarchaeota archaeon]|nr:hypothetical protein [Candidatus Lokiarchaeota archaeon]